MFLSKFKVYLNPKVIAVMLLGFSSGLPLALIMSTLSIWLAESQIDKTTIGFFALIGIPYTFKFCWSPLIDHLNLPFLTKILGRRRGWIVFTQILLIISIIALGSTDPSKDAFITGVFALIVAFCSASQDIVIDAYRVEILEERQQGAGAAIVVFGYRIGMLVSGAGALFFATYFGWFLTYIIMALFILVGMVTAIITGEPIQVIEKKSNNSDNKLIDWLIKAVFNPFANFIQRPNWIFILLFIVLYKFGDAFIAIMTNPFYIDMGFSKVDIASIVKTFGLGATLIGAFIGGYLINKYGIFKSLVFCGILQMLSNLMFAAQVIAGKDLLFLTLTISVENLSGGMGTAAFVAYISSLCNIQYTATQYALFSSLASFARTLLSSSSGWFVDNLGWMEFFILSTTLAIPGLLVLFWLGKTKINIKKNTPQMLEA